MATWRSSTLIPTSLPRALCWTSPTAHSEFGFGERHNQTERASPPHPQAICSAQPLPTNAAPGSENRDLPSQRSVLWQRSQCEMGGREQ